jgi:protein-disulfide isomerase
MQRTLLPALAVALSMAACGPADANGAAAAPSSAPAGQNLAMVAQIGFNDLLRDPGVPLLGAEDPDIVIVGYVDYNCTYCKKMQPVVDAVMTGDAKVSVLYKDWPIFGAVSEKAARAALAAGYQGKYQEVHYAFMQSPSRIASDADIRRLAEGAGVDMARLDRDLSDHRAEIDAVLRRNGREAAALALQGTPAFVVNGHLIPGALPQATLEMVITRIRSGQSLR